jgi:3-methyladenine DNA glycosylase AlkD
MNRSRNVKKHSPSKAAKKSAPAARRSPVAAPQKPDLKTVLAALKRLGSKKVREGMARYAIPSHNALGVPMNKMQQVARQFGRNHELALALWETGVYEARTVAAYVDDPARVTPAQMERWCRDFDSWAIVDTVCFVLFDRTPHAFAKIEEWAGRKDEFQKRAAFALLACVALHNKTADEQAFLDCLPLVEQAAGDERNFVKKGVSWAIRSVGRRSLALNSAAIAVCKRMAASPHSAAQWVGKTALKELASPAIRLSLEKRARKATIS